MKNYRLTKFAKSDLRDISHYTQRQFNATQRRKYIKVLDKAFDKICQNPGIGRQREEFSEQLFCYPCQNHFIIYRKKKRLIEILRILNMNMDIARHLYAFNRK